jgi:hypothetical protein
MNLNQLKVYIKGKIYPNQSKSVTGDILQEVLVTMVDTIPDNIEIPDVDTTQFATAAQGAKADTALQDASAFATAAQGVKADNAATQTNFDDLQSEIDTKWTETSGKSWVETLLVAMETGFFTFRGIVSSTPPDNSAQNTNFGDGTLWFVNNQEIMSNLIADTFWICYVIQNGTWSATANTTYGIEGSNKPNVDESLGDLWHNRNSDTAFYRFDFSWKEFSANIDLSDVWIAISGHTHTRSQITDFTHTHGVGDVTNLQSNLDGKSNSGHTHVWDNITDRPTSMAPTSHALNSHSGLGTIAQYLRGDASLATFPTTWAYSALTDVPTTFTPSTHNHTWAQITDRPTTWAWGSITGAPTTYAPSSHAINSHSGLGTTAQYLRGDGSLATFPTIPTNNNQLTNGAGYVTATHNHTWANITDRPTIPAAQVSSDWNATSGVSQILNKPTIPAAYTHPANHPASMITGLSTVATSGSYNDLSNRPTIPTNNNQLTNGAGYVTGTHNHTWGQITDRPTTWAWGSITGAPTIPTNNNQLTNGAGYVTGTHNHAWGNISGVPIVRNGNGTAESLVGFNDAHGTQIHAAGGFFQQSDERLKDIIEDFEPEYALEAALKLRKIFFNYKEDEETQHVGVIAQEIQEYYPELVSEVESKDGKSTHLTVDYPKLSVVALAAIEGMYDMISEMRNEIEDLKKKNI